jgi:tubulin beta
MFKEVKCGEKSTGCGGEYCGDIDAQLGRINVFYHEASGGKYVPCAMLKEFAARGTFLPPKASPLCTLMRSRCGSLSPQYSLLPSMPCSSHTTS